ncbi:MAG: helix-turn-helix domain-containing protein [Christensenella sp.]|nr:helix-turn-helix domain-containing protein [Christensenella sp.]
MGNAEQTQEAILAATQALIIESNGNADAVTIRQIAARAGVSVGLVNHYYASKELLLEACVQRMIGGVIGAFQPDVPAATDTAERLGRVAGQVADFLAEHQQISRISILGDLQRPNAADNTMASVRGFSYTIASGVPDADAKLRAFCLTAILQVAFLRKETMLETVGIDFNDKQQRDAFLLRALEWLLSERR